jgi:hypothetical protein
MTLVAVKEAVKEKGKDNPIVRTPNPTVFDDIVIFCPGCKAMQSVQISSKQLLPTRKFTQVGPFIYHDCGSNIPCRLYQNI